MTDFSQGIDDLLSYAIAEIFIFFTGTHINKREYRYAEVLLPCFHLLQVKQTELSGYLVAFYLRIKGVQQISQTICLTLCIHTQDIMSSLV